METTEIEVVKKELSLIEKDYNAIVITNTEQLNHAGEFLYRIKEYIKNANAQKKKLIDPFKLAIENLESELDPAIDKAKLMKKVYDEKISTYQMAIIAKQREEETARKMAEMSRLETKKEELETAAAEKNSNVLLDEALKVENAQEKLMAQPIKVQSTVKGDFVNTGIRITWDYEVISEEEVPREYCNSSAGKLRKALNDGVREIKGVRIFEKANVTSRT